MKKQKFILQVFYMNYFLYGYFQVYVFQKKQLNLYNLNNISKKYQSNEKF